MRQPAVAGQFYAGTKEDLLEEIKNCYMSPLGPGVMPKKVDGPREIKGLVVPHAGFIYSGPIAAHSSLELARDSLPESYVILGPNHSGMGAPIALSTKDFVTPFGTVKNDKELTKALLDETVFEDDTAHKFEHSIEVQLPFLQQIEPDIKFVPISMGLQDYESANQLGEAIGRVTKGKNVVVIASTDFSHYVPLQYAYKVDKMAIDKILALDPKGLSNVVNMQRISMCGYGPVIAMLTATKMNGAKEAKLLKYATSGDVHKMRDVVGYGAIAIR
jgi:AmmeMemoRadiSam system protein B